MHMSREKVRATGVDGRSVLCAAVPWMIASMALAKTVPFTAGQFKVDSGIAPSAASAIHENVKMRSLTIGDRVLRLDDGRQRAPIHVRVTEIDDAGLEGAPIDSGEAAPLALTPDIQRPIGMSALDAFSSFDLGRMLRGDGTKALRVQVFLSMQERDDDAFADDAMPELVVLGGTEGSVRVTPILDGSPDVPASLAFGQARAIPAEAFAQGRLPVTIGFTGDMDSQSIGAVGLDLSGDLGVGPGKSVVGYQIDLPVGSRAPVKVLAAGEVEFGAYANFADVAPVLAQAALGQLGSDNAALDSADDAATKVVGPVFIGEGEGRTTPSYAELPLGPDFRPNDLLGFQESGSWPITTPPPDAPVIPAPGAIALVSLAGLCAGRRRRHR
jgi:MYXO-CTERM domain-containing protein